MADKQQGMPANDRPAGEPVPDSGHASNPAPGSDPGKGNQLLDKKAEKYLRESGNIEDMPDAQDEQAANEQSRH